MPRPTERRPRLPIVNAEASAKQRIVGSRPSRAHDRVARPRFDRKRPSAFFARMRLGRRPKSTTFDRGRYTMRAESFVAGVKPCDL